LPEFNEFKNQIKESAALMTSLLTPAFQNLFTSVLSGKGSLDDFFKSLGNSVKQLISQLLAAAAIALLLSSITGGSFGKIFGKLTGLGGFGKGLAEGGVVPEGFPNDTFPARLTSNEAVIPLNRLPGLIGGIGGGNINITGKLRGKDLYMINQRESRRLQRVA